MTTLMQWGNSEGIQGRCDSKCHEAKYPECDCMCGGAFHGRAHSPGGLQQAVEEYWEPVFAAAKQEAAARGMIISGTPGATRQMEFLFRRD